MTSQLNDKNWNNFGSICGFDLRFFLKAIFLEGASLEKIKFHKVRCHSWSEVPLKQL